METVELADWTLRLDRQATTAFYEQRTPLTCDCGNCRNFIAAFELLPDDVRAMFEGLGIDPRREGGEVYHYMTNEDGSLLYGGVMVFAGELVAEAPNYAVTVGQGTTFNESTFASGLTGGFTREDSLVALIVPDQPDPHVVFRFTVDRVPWVLPESPDGSATATA